MPDYPAYVRQMLDEAREQGQWYCGQYDAAAGCFDILALFPDHQEAATLAYALFCDEWLIFDTRTALQQQIDEWDDRPWQQRRRLALSLRFLSRWEDRHAEDRPGNPHARRGPPDVAELLEQGHMLLLEAYCLGDDACTDLAWPLFDQAFRRSDDPRDALLWVGKQYADLGFFADAVEVLAEYCSRFDDQDARRLLAEVRWWRDNAYRLPWLPPPGDGARYRRMMSFIDPDAPSDQEVIEELRARAARGRDRSIWQPVIAPDFARLVESALAVALTPAEPAATLVDWSFLDQDDGQPGEMPDWAKRQMRLFGKHMPDAFIRQYRWSRPISPPATPKRYDPAEPPFDPADELEDDDLELGDNLFDADDDDLDEGEPF
jgi:hypothetical protein